MIVLNRKRLIAIAGMICVALLVFSFQITNTKQIKDATPTVALPVSSKVIVIDAGHGVPDEGEYLLTLKVSSDGKKRFI